MKECEATKDKGNRNELNGRKIYGRTSNDFFVKIKKGKDLKAKLRILCKKIKAIV